VSASGDVVAARDVHEFGQSYMAAVLAERVWWADVSLMYDGGLLTLDQLTATTGLSERSVYRHLSNGRYFQTLPLLLEACR
jgi:hypothetical protein